MCNDSVTTNKNKKQARGDLDHEETTNYSESLSNKKEEAMKK